MSEINLTKDIKDTPYCFEESQMPFLRKVSERVQEMRKAGQLTSDVLGKIRKYFRIKSIYNSNAIEGNILNVRETRLVVESGLTITGKSLTDQAEAKNLKEALDFLEDLAGSNDKPITEADVRQIHYLVLKGIDDSNAGKYRSVKVEISGSKFKPPGPESVPPEMNEFGKWLSGVSSMGENYGIPEAILYSAAAHTWFVYIHPFIDGNGRVARLLMDLLLMRYGYPIAIITKADRLRYYDALEISQTSDLSPFVSLVTECVSESLEEYEEAVKENKEQKEWAAGLASRLSNKEYVRSRNEYEVWKSAMELLRSHFRKAAELLNDAAWTVKIYFKDFGDLEYDKYLGLKLGESAKKTWFFRVDFVSGERSARYLFFFGSPSRILVDQADVTLHLSREHPPKSFYYERLEHIGSPNVPSILEIGYRAESERFVVKGKSGRKKMDNIDKIGMKFFEEVISLHFQ